MFWEGHKVLKKNPNFFDTSLWRQTNWEILSKLCGLLRICQLYNNKDIHLLCAFLRKNRGYAPGNTLFTMVCCCYSARPSCCFALLLTHPQCVQKNYEIAFKFHVSTIWQLLSDQNTCLIQIEKYLTKYL